MLKTKTHYIPATNLVFGPRYASTKMVEIAKLESTKTKIGLTVLAVFSVIIGAYVRAIVPLPDWATFMPFQAWLWSMMFSVIAIWQGLTTNKVDTEDAHHNLSDEAKSLLKSVKQIEDAKALYPESSGYMLRCDQFQKLAFEMIQKLVAMGATSVGRSTNSTKQKLISELQIEAKNLAISGMDLADLMAIKRAENVVTDAGFLGTSQFMDDINVEMATYRALGPGPSQEDKQTSPKGTQTKSSSTGSSKTAPKSGVRYRKIADEVIAELVDDYGNTTRRHRMSSPKEFPTDKTMIDQLLEEATNIELEIIEAHIEYEHKYSDWYRHCKECQKYNLCRCDKCLENK